MREKEKKIEDIIRNIKPEGIKVDLQEVKKVVGKYLKQVAKEKYRLDVKFLGNELVSVKMKISYDIFTDITMKPVSIKIGDDIYPLEKITYKPNKEDT